MRRALGGVLVVGFAIGLAGCGFGGPDPQPTADAAARALGRHDVHTVEFTGPDGREAGHDRPRGDARRHGPGAEHGHRE